jgi:hypothetical protein
VGRLIRQGRVPRSGTPPRGARAWACTPAARSGGSRAPGPACRPGGHRGRRAGRGGDERQLLADARAFDRPCIRAAESRGRIRGHDRHPRPNSRRDRDQAADPLDRDMPLPRMHEESMSSVSERRGRSMPAPLGFRVHNRSRRYRAGEFLSVVPPRTGRRRSNLPGTSQAHEPFGGGNSGEQATLAVASCASPTG